MWSEESVTYVPESTICGHGEGTAAAVAARLTAAAVRAAKPTPRRERLLSGQIRAIALARYYIKLAGVKAHRTLTPRQEALAERNLCVALAALRTPEEVKAFLRDLCTPAEIQAMADRWAVVEPLKRSVPYREIHRLTGVSVTTIGRVARFLAGGYGGYETAQRRLEAARRTSHATVHA